MSSKRDTSDNNKSDTTTLSPTVTKNTSEGSNLSSTSTNNDTSEVTATASDGCVQCEPVKCPTCAEDEYCVMTSLTCYKCPITYCNKNTDDSGLISSLNNDTAVSNTTNATNNVYVASKSVNSGKLGGIIGGSVGGCLFAIVVLILFWQRYKKRNQKERDAMFNGKLVNNSTESFELKNANDKDGVDGIDKKNGITNDNIDIDIDDDDDDDDDDSIFDEELINEMFNSKNKKGSSTLISSGSGNSSKNKNKGKNDTNSNNNSSTLLSNANSNGTYNNLNGLRSMQRPMNRNILQPRDRMSMASTVRTGQTGQSNILPIAYIPGVTTAVPPSGLRNANQLRNPRLNNLMDDARSHITLGSSILEGVYDENDMRSLKSKAGSIMTTTIGVDNKLTTAIKAKPKLIQINENEDDDGNNEKNDFKEVNKLNIPLAQPLNSNNGNNSTNNTSIFDPELESFLIGIDMPEGTIMTTSTNNSMKHNAVNNNGSNNSNNSNSARNTIIIPKPQPPVPAARRKTAPINSTVNDSSSVKNTSIKSIDTDLATNSAYTKSKENLNGNNNGNKNNTANGINSDKNNNSNNNNTIDNTAPIKMENTNSEIADEESKKENIVQKHTTAIENANTQKGEGDKLNRNPNTHKRTSSNTDPFGDSNEIN